MFRQIVIKSGLFTDAFRSSNVSTSILVDAIQRGSCSKLSTSPRFSPEPVRQQNWPWKPQRSFSNASSAHSSGNDGEVVEVPSLAQPKAESVSTHTKAKRAVTLETSKVPKGTRVTTKSSKQPKRKSGTKKSSTKKSGTKKPSTKKSSSKKTAGRRKPRTEAQKKAVEERKVRVELKQLKVDALVEPKKKPDTAWTVFVSSFFSKGAKVTEVVKNASSAYKSLGPSEREVSNPSGSNYRHQLIQPTALQSQCSAKQRSEQYRLQELG